MDVHRKFSNVTLRDARGEVVARERLDHVDRRKLREHLARWPKGTLLVMEASFGWPWLSDEVEATVHDPVKRRGTRPFHFLFLFQPRRGD